MLQTLPLCLRWLGSGLGNLIFDAERIGQRSHRTGLPTSLNRTIWWLLKRERVAGDKADSREVPKGTQGFQNWCHAVRWFCFLAHKWPIILNQHDTQNWIKLQGTTGPCIERGSFLICIYSNMQEACTNIFAYTHMHMLMHLQIHRHICLYILINVHVHVHIRKAVLLHVYI